MQTAQASRDKPLADGAGHTFFGEGRIDPLAEPGLVFAPAQALVEQDLIDAAALHRNPLHLMKIGG